MRINIPTKSLSSNSGVGAENNNSTTAAGGNVKSLSVPELNITSDTFSKSTAKRQSRQKSSDTKPAMSNTATAEADETHDSVSELMFRSGSSMNMLESPVDSHSRLSSASSLNLIKQSIFFKPSANRIDQRLQPASNSLSVNDNLLLSTSMTTAPLTAAAGGNFSYANASYNFSSLSGIQDDREIEIASHPSELEEGNSGHVEHGAAQFSKSLPKSEANNADSFGQASRANTSNLLENHLSLQQQKLELNSSSMPNINSSSVAAPHSPSSTRNSTASFSTRMRKNTPATSSTSSIVIGEKSLGPLLVQPLLFRKFSKEIPEILFNDLNIHETYAYEADMEDFSQHGINAAVIEIKNVYLWEAPNHAITCEISSKSGKTEIKTASVPALVHALVAGNMTTDHDFLTDFLRTYRYFSNSIDIARLLIMSYIDSMSISKTEGQKVNSNTSNSTASSAKQMTLEDRSAQIQFKILNVFKKWISEQPADFELDSSFSQLLIHFLDLYVQKDEKKGVFAVKMLEQMDALLYNSNYNNAASPGSQVSSSVPRPAIPKQIPSDDTTSKKSLSKKSIQTSTGGGFAANIRKSMMPMKKPWISHDDISVSTADAGSTPKNQKSSALPEPHSVNGSESLSKFSFSSLRQFAYKSTNSSSHSLHSLNHANTAAVESIPKMPSLDNIIKHSSSTGKISQKFDAAAKASSTENLLKYSMSSGKIPQESTISILPQMPKALFFAPNRDKNASLSSISSNSKTDNSPSGSNSNLAAKGGDSVEDTYRLAPTAGAIQSYHLRKISEISAFGIGLASPVLSIAPESDQIPSPLVSTYPPSIPLPVLPKSTSDLIRNSTPSPTANDQNLQIHSRASRLSSISSDNNDAEYLVVEEYCRRSADDLSVSATPVYGNDEINGLRLLPIPSRLISVVTGSGGGSGSTLSPGIRSASTRGSTGGDSIIAYYEKIQKSNISPASPLSPLSPTDLIDIILKHSVPATVADSNILGNVDESLPELPHLGESDSKLKGVASDDELVAVSNRHTSVATQYSVNSNYTELSSNNSSAPPVPTVPRQFSDSTAIPIEDKITPKSSPAMTRRKSGQISSGTFGFRSIIETGESSISEAPKNVSLRQVTILDVDPDELARQLTVLEHELFRSISLHEFYCQAWSHKTSKNKLAPNLVKFIRYFNHVATGAASEVVRQTNIKARVSVLKKFIYVAHTCIKWANYNTCFEIVAGLNLGPITRLKRTWKALPKKYWDVWNELNQIVSSEGSYKAYRQSIGPLKEKLGDIPILPYIGVNLSDLTFTEDGNATFIQEAPASSSSSNHGEQQTSTLSSQIPPKIVGLSEKTIRSIPRQPIVNFSKLRLVSKLMSDVVLQQRGPRYTFVPENKTLEWIYDGWPLLSENDLYTQSKICEPRQPDA